MSKESQNAVACRGGRWGGGPGLPPDRGIQIVSVTFFACQHFFSMETLTNYQFGPGHPCEVMAFKLSQQPFLTPNTEVDGASWHGTAKMPVECASM